MGGGERCEDRGMAHRNLYIMGSQLMRIRKPRPDDATTPGMDQADECGNIAC